MYQTTQALQMNVKYMQQDMLRDAAADHMAREAHGQDKGERAAFQHKLVALAVALVTVLGVVALF